MRLPSTAQTSQPWHIHEITRDFALEDVWALPTPGGPDDFPRLVDVVTSFDPAEGSSRIVRALFAIRFKVGAQLGWDAPAAGLAGRVSTVRERLPAELRAEHQADSEGPLGFTPLYQTDDEWAVEIANRTVHGILHLGWVPDPAGGYRGQMAIYVKRNGLLGTVYMAGITPFRHVLVYPAIMRELERRWRAQAGTAPA